MASAGDERNLDPGGCGRAGGAGGGGRAARDGQDLDAKLIGGCLDAAEHPLDRRCQIQDHRRVRVIVVAVAAGKTVHDDVKLELVIDDLAVISSDLALVNRDLLEMGR